VIKVILKMVYFSVFAFYVLWPKETFCQNAFESALKKKMDSLAIAPAVFVKAELLPNDAVQSVMTPTGFGGYGAYVFGGMGATYPQVYSKLPDGIASAGFCFGDPTKLVNVAFGFNVGKVLAFSDFSTNFIISRKLWTGTSISAGALQAFASAKVSDAPIATFYAAFSHSLQWLPSKTPNYSALTYTIGVGNGRFWQKSPADIAAGKGNHGTGVFGDISYEIFKRVDLNAEWTGVNLGFSTGIRPFVKSALSLGIGVTNLTSYSSDKPSMVFSIGYPLSLGGLIH
jgi:hypothetical protein